MNDAPFKFDASVISLPFISVVLLWLVYWFGIHYQINLDFLGIYPRTLRGLLGIAFSPFVHGTMEHLFNNSIPLLLLIAALRYFYSSLSVRILFYGTLISGCITWIIGRESYHIGASGLVYVLVSFIFFKGIISRYYRLVALSLTVILVYGSLIWYVFPDIDKEISWEGHLAGLITGLGFALYYKTPAYVQQTRYDWEQPDYNPEDDKFLQRFDADGNFVNIPKEEDAVFTSYYSSNIPVEYEIVKNEKKGLKPES